MVAIFLAVLIIGGLLIAPALADIAIGVKKGDWIEYQTATTGNLPGHDSKWAMTEVMDVQGSVLNLNMTTLFNNGTYLYENITLNLQTGHLGDDFFIPANLSVGDAFYDEHVGNITITGSAQRTYAGAERTVLTATVVTNKVESTTFWWDKQTGIMVQAFSNYPDYNFTMRTIANATNMWQPTPSPANSTMLYVLITVTAIVVIAVAAVILVRYNKKPKPNVGKT
jgi:hypothetical protein